MIFTNQPNQRTMSTPKSIELSHDAKGEKGIAIAWDDGHSAFYPFAFLRKACPCAVCKGERLPFDPDPLALPVYKPLPPNMTEAKDMFKIGRYAIGFKWGDGHDTGIYSFDYLRKMCPCSECAG